MKSYIFCLKTILLAMFFMSTNAISEQEEETIALDEDTWYFAGGVDTGTLAANVLGPLYGSGLGLGYGMGGYGDTSVAGNLTACTDRTVDRSNCTQDPGSGPLEWRFIKNLGWRKFSPYGAARKDWWDYKKTIGWPFRQDPRNFY